jgi:hypothetical protein
VFALAVADHAATPATAPPTVPGVLPAVRAQPATLPIVRQDGADRTLWVGSTP